MEEVTLYFLFITSILLYLFLLNYAGQKVTDYNDHVFLTA